MNSINSLIIEGVVVGEPCYEDTCLTYTIAVKRTYKDAEWNEVTEVSNFKVVCFGDVAEFANKYTKEGVSVRVVGRLKEYKWSDGDGITHSGVQIIAEHIEYRNLVKKE